MSHEITSTDNFGEIRARGQRAWHGLGEVVEPGKSAREGFRQLEIDWSTTLEPVYVHSTEVVSTPDGSASVERATAVPSARAHLRVDTGDVLGIVSKFYRPIQNVELAEFADALTSASTNVELETAGTLYGGKRVFALMRLGDSFDAVKGDEIKPYVLVSNGHGGTASFSAMLTSVRVVCANTLAWAESSTGDVSRFRHSGNMEDKLAAAKSVLGFAVAGMATYRDQVRSLVGFNLTGQRLENVLHFTYDQTYGRLPASADEKTRAAWEGKRNATVSAWRFNFEQDEKNNLPGIAGTGWAAFNAITQWHDHDRGKLAPQSERRMASNIFGASARDKRKAFDVVLEQAALVRG